MAKQTFTVGQVLTAAQMTSLQQTAMGGGSTTAKTASYTLLAADAGTVVQMNSASATTITVNTALFAAGDTVQIQNVGVGVCTVTAGTATVSTSATLALKQYDAGSLYFNTTSAAIFFASDAADSSSPLTTKGDLYGFSTLDARIPIGTNNQVLTADSAQALGLKWATPSSTAQNFSLLNSSGTSLSGSSTSITGISGMNSLYIMVENASSASASSYIYFTLNTDTTAANYPSFGVSFLSPTADGETNLTAGGLGIGRQNNSASGLLSGAAVINGCNSAGVKAWQSFGSGDSTASGTLQRWQTFNGVYTGSSTVSSVQVRSSSGNFDGGKVYIYGSA